MARLVLLALTALLAQVMTAPVEVPQEVTVQREAYASSAYREDGRQSDYYPEEEQGENELQRLEKEVAQAETANLLAGAIQAEQKLESGILSSAAAVAAAGIAPGPPGETEEARQRRKAAAEEEMEVLEEMVERDKRAVGIIQGILGGSSGGGEAAAADDATTQESAGSGSKGSGGVLFSLISSFLSGSSSSSSGGANTTADADTDDANSSGRFSALGLITSSVSTVLRIKFSIFRTLFSLVKGLLTSS